MRFTTTLASSGKNTTGIVLSEETVTSLGAGKRPAVKVTLNGYTYRTTIGKMGGQYMISVSAEIRRAAGVSAGDQVAVEVELDTEPRTVTVPPDLGAALDANPEARRRFEALSYSHRKAHVLSIEDAKTAETRQRRIAKAIEQLLAR